MPRRSFLPEQPKKRRRRSFMIWESMCVLSAHGGTCVYCSREAESMDHLIPFADGGLDDLNNLVPACQRCNNKKRKRDPVVWHLMTSMAGEWRGDGTIRSGAGARGLSLRDLYLERHEEALGWLEHLEEVTAEVCDYDRQMWFLNRFFHLGYDRGQSSFWSATVALSVFHDTITKAHEQGFPKAEH